MLNYDFSSLILAQEKRTEHPAQHRTVNNIEEK
jgi:hypothetical protein